MFLKSSIRKTNGRPVGKCGAHARRRWKTLRPARLKFIHFTSCIQLHRQSSRPALVLRAMETHVTLERLLDVAADDDLTFTTEESYHLEVCSQCFTIWTEFISQSVRDEGVTSKLA